MTTDAHQPIESVPLVDHGGTTNPTHQMQRVRVVWLLSLHFEMQVEALVGHKVVRARLHLAGVTAQSRLGAVPAGTR